MKPSAFLLHVLCLLNVPFLTLTKEALKYWTNPAEDVLHFCSGTFMEVKKHRGFSYSIYQTRFDYLNVLYFRKQSLL